ncbi:MAG: hypothetical protein WCT10_01355 [Patescibacteria group bacterium]|jgi:hypothetical protein
MSKNPVTKLVFENHTEDKLYLCLGTDNGRLQIYVFANPVDLPRIEKIDLEPRSVANYEINDLIRSCIAAGELKFAIINRSGRALRLEQCQGIADNVPCFVFADRSPTEKWIELCSHRLEER